MSDTRTISELLYTAAVVQLDGLDFARQFTRDEIAAAYNGIGAEEWPEEWRRAITRCFNLFQPAALIHDLRFTYANGTRRDFNFANVEFHNNCLKLARFSIPWWRVLRRFLADGSALAFYEAVSSPFGWDAYVKATSKN